MEATIKNFKIEKFKRDVKDGVTKTVNYAVDFAHKNPVVAVAIIGVVGKTATTAIRAASRRRALSIETAREAARALEVWDPSVGVHYILRRPMSGSEAMKLSELMANGMKKLDALKELGLV